MRRSDQRKSRGKSPMGTPEARYSDNKTILTRCHVTF